MTLGEIAQNAREDYERERQDQQTCRDCGEKVIDCRCQHGEG